MIRTFSVHEVREGHILVLFVGERPITTLRGENRNELSAIGAAWVNAATTSAAVSVLAAGQTSGDSAGKVWDGVDRRKTPRHV